jgi:hypothetical protein
MIARHSTHLLSHSRMFVRIFFNILGWTVAQQSVIPCREVTGILILTAFTCVFKNPQNEGPSQVIVVVTSLNL